MTEKKFVTSNVSTLRMKDLVVRYGYSLSH